MAFNDHKVFEGDRVKLKLGEGKDLIMMTLNCEKCFCSPRRGAVKQSLGIPELVLASGFLLLEVYFLIVEISQDPILTVEWQ